jgi:hypothetical protein
VFESARRPSGLLPLLAVICLQLVPLLAWVVPIDLRSTVPFQPAGWKCERLPSPPPAPAMADRRW